eukprot:CAMPEP_0179378944 /NCGR_PEP_ID=MMETSP0797-20121207/89590_1 /TAXON_ID=47934 /ORGANISM="Dinophysis acuminata, Strain DAEP01" /LENGTH=145 /DNA_ID=CAMNT_0021095019 /DNA_START=59 /DNA_END=493 /DNA_ORIENTATION=+
MALTPDFFLGMPEGPPPQAVLNQRVLWFLLMFMLGATMLLRMLAFDLLAGTLCGLLLMLAAVIVRDGMRELSKYSLAFGMLSAVNFFFYVFPMINSIVSGRSTRRVDPVDSVSYSDTERLTYTLTVRTTPFFDASAGALYNVQSA